MSDDSLAPDLAGPMQVQLARRQAALNSGATSVGWKVAFNGLAMQQHFGIKGLVVGHITNATVLDPEQLVTISNWHQPMLEVELALRIGSDGGIAGIAPALELVDIDLPFDQLAPILEGNIFHRGVVFGPESQDPELRGLEVAVTRDAEVVARGTLNDDPAATVTEVRTFLERHEAILSPGERIIAGSLITPLTLNPGDHVDVSFGSLGSLSLTFR